MAYITFITTYKPIICGIADYSDFLTRESTPGTWAVITFDLDNFVVPFSDDLIELTTPVSYCIPSREDYTADSISKWLKLKEAHVLWFQHEFGIWGNGVRFTNMLRELNDVTVVSPHTLHFQSNETTYGLRKFEDSFLRSLLPSTDAITVFSDGVYSAVTRAFPEYSDKVHVMRHGTHCYPTIARMSRAEAKAKIYDYLMYESNLDQASKDRIQRENVFTDPATTLIGGTGFITANKGIELIYQVRNTLLKMLPQQKMVAVYVGFLREPDNIIDGGCAAKLRAKYNGSGQFFLENYLPEEMLPIMLRAFDIHFYWPGDCTQSGIIAHALGAGATIACRDMEGVGETVKMAGGLARSELGQLITGIKELILNPELRDEISQRAVRYAMKFSWKNQALKHFELAEELCRSKAKRSITGSTLLLSASLKENRLPL
ncbi:MAG TPA: hypothetical protein G4O13_01220 [Dehalococcoidia bacterium]|nr:hypothetical protein [Dehalococcoidia bacterium]